MKFLVLFVVLLALKAHALCVKYESANLRSGPGPNHKVTWTVPLYTPLLQIDKKGSWYQVKDQDGETHWIYNKAVTSRMKCVAVKTNKANLRTGPTSSSALGDINSADKYTPFKRRDIADNGWYKVESNWGGTYWLHPNLVWRPVRIRGVSF